MPDGGSVAIHQDITAQKRAEEKISHLAHYDALTNLANRVRFLEHVNAAAENYRAHGKTFAVHLLDLDHFKEVNDSLGHAVGDALADRDRRRGCGDSVGPGDVVARLGGDEFTVLQDDRRFRRRRRRRCWRTGVLQVIGKPFDIDGHLLTVETSIGIAVAPDHGLVANELLKKRRPRALSRQVDGRNGWRLFESRHGAGGPFAAGAGDGPARVRSSGRNSSCTTSRSFQLANEDAVGVEALLRWRDGPVAN